MLELRCFGGVRITDEAGAERVLRSRKHLALLLYIVAHPRTVHSREELAYLLWDGNGRRERHSLSQALYDIRSNVGPVLEVDTHSVRLIPERVALETDQLEEALQTQDHRRALDVYRGEFAPNLLNLGVESFDRWLDSERGRCRVLAALSLRNAQRASEERGNWDQMCLAALRLIKQNEFDEEAHCALMRGLWLKGDNASALAHYEALCGGDRTAVGAWGSAKRLAARIRRSGADGLVARDHGARLIGRDDEFAALVSRLDAASQEPRVGLISGPPGIGKSALATEFAFLVHARATLTRHGGGFEGGGAWWSPCQRVVVWDKNRVDEEIMGRAYERSEAANAFVLVTMRACSLPAGAACLDSWPRIELGPLSSVQTRQLARLRAPSCSPRLVQAAHHWSAGNPGMALALMDASLVTGHEPWSTAEESAWIDKLLANSHEVRRTVQAWLADLTQAELAVLRAASVLTEGAQLVANSVFTAADQIVALRSLMQRQYVVCVGQHVRVVSPLLERVARLQAGAQARQIHRKAADRLLGGGLRERYAAAGELLAANDRPSAHAVALGVAKEAIADGQPELAADAGAFAHDVAHQLEDRLEAGFLAAEAAIVRGRPHDAAAVLRDLGAIVTRPEDIVRQRIWLAKATSPVSARADFEAALKGSRDALRGVDDEGVRRNAELLLASLQLALHLSTADSKRMATAAEALEKSILATRDLTTVAPAPWSDAVKTLFHYLIRWVSREKAESVLYRLVPILMRLPDPHPASARLWRAICAYRRADLWHALELTDSVWESREGAVDRARSVAVNNAGVLRMELGEFRRASELLAAGQHLDELLGAEITDRVATELNQAQCYLYSNQPIHARATLKPLLEGLESQGCRAPQGQGYAIAGLLALQTGDVAAAVEVAERLEDPARNEPWGDDSYLVTWFRAAYLRQLKEQDAGDILGEEAQRLASFDTLGSYKLHVLADRLSDRRDETPAGREAANALRHAGAAWFVRFADRWNPHLCPPIPRN